MLFFLKSKIYSGIFYAVALLFVFTGCSEQEVRFSGKTMGTTYHIKVAVGRFDNTDALKEKIDRQLDVINRSMSTYRKDSEISRFNDLNHAGTPFAVSMDFLQVMIMGKDIHARTKGAWDATVYPLLKLWGFKDPVLPDSILKDSILKGSISKNSIPEDEDIRAALEKTGFDKIEISEEGVLIKNHPDVTLDLASIAKGYGVDRVAALIEKHGYDRYIVEIGGEIYAAGLRLDGEKWRVGINTPDKEAASDTVYQVVSLNDHAFATSGDYRNFFEYNGKTYSHIIDPNTGYPVNNRVVSASVIADNCTFADGLATALMVMGPEKGLALINGLEDAECLIIVREKDGSLTNHASAGFITEK